MKGYNLLKNTSGTLGLIHMLSCTRHGLLGVALALGAGSFLPKKTQEIVTWPHRFMVNNFYYPIFNKLVSEEKPLMIEEENNRLDFSKLESHCSNSCCAHDKISQEVNDLNYRAYDLAHKTSAIVGYGSLATFLGLYAFKKTKRRRGENN